MTVRTVYLVGIKHSGKSSVGRHAVELLAPSMPIRFIDTDDLVAHAMPSHFSSVREFFRVEGQSAFRELEHAALSSFLASRPPCLQVVSTGGGACDNGPLVELMKSSGTIIYLEVAEDTLFERIMRGGIPPFLSTVDPRGSFHELYVRRNALYRQISQNVVSLSDYRSVQENAQILAACLRRLIESEAPCREIPLELH